MQIQGVSALVSGAGRGIGRAIALALAREGALVTVLSRTIADLDSLVTEILDSGGRAVAFSGDVRDPSVCDGAVAAAIRAHGGLAVLVNNAGVGLQANLAETTDEQWDRVVRTNLTAPFRLTRAALPYLVKAGNAHVFMISSLAGSNPLAGMSAYCASKAALDHLAACLLLEVRPLGVKVSTIAPGSVATSFGGTARDAAWMLRPDDVAATLLDLLRSREGAHTSRVEMRPARPPKH